ncbi:MAG: 6-bladed beta-propeller, partial [Acidobacteria bacterium]|nr:6-bladed beta-propeller [Acidobacteriota bacterium]
MKKSGVWGLLLIGLILVFFFVSACSREEKIEIKKENGATVVYNPKKPVPPRGVPSTLSLKEELALGKTGNEETMLLNPRAVDVDQNGNIYVIDRKAVQIKVYDPQGNFIRAIGRRGQGPGEFQTIWSFQVTPQQTIFVCPRCLHGFEPCEFFLRRIDDKFAGFAVHANSIAGFNAAQQIADAK